MRWYKPTAVGKVEELLMSACPAVITPVVVLNQLVGEDAGGLFCVGGPSHRDARSYPCKRRHL